MIFNNHSNLEGQHAFLGASKYHWINYDETKVADAYSKFLATQRGTVLHDFACQCITLGQKLPKSQKTLNMYVNDAISFRMVPEQILFYSENCFGTADTIVFRNGTLRIHDLKTGVVPAHMEQLEIYVTKMINALGIGDYVKTTTMTTELGKKVDKVEGSRLMTNAEGTKLAGIAAGAQANVIEKIKVNGVEVTPAAEDKSIALTIPTGKLAGKDIVAETDLDAALKEKVNAAAEGNHSHANKVFLDTLSGATDEEVTAMCTEVFGA